MDQGVLDVLAANGLDYLWDQDANRPSAEGLALLAANGLTADDRFGTLEVLQNEGGTFEDDPGGGWEEIPMWTVLVWGTAREAFDFDSEEEAERFVAAIRAVADWLYDDEQVRLWAEEDGFPGRGGLDDPLARAALADWYLEQGREAAAALARARYERWKGRGRGGGPFVRKSFRGRGRRKSMRPEYERLLVDAGLWDAEVGGVTSPEVENLAMSGPFRLGRQEGLLMEDNHWVEDRFGEEVVLFDGSQLWVHGDRDQVRRWCAALNELYQWARHRGVVRRTPEGPVSQGRRLTDAQYQEEARLHAADALEANDRLTGRKSFGPRSRLSRLPPDTSTSR